MSKRRAQPSEFKAFEKLTKQLLAVPKAELDKKMQRYEAKKKRKKR